MLSRHHSASRCENALLHPRMCQYTYYQTSHITTLLGFNVEVSCDDISTGAHVSLQRERTMAQVQLTLPLKLLPACLNDEDCRRL